MSTWTIQVINIATMERIHDREYTDTELIELLLTDSFSSWQQVFENADQCGMEFEFSIADITDCQKFVESFIVHLIGEDWEVTRTEPHAHNDIDRGHLDFRIEYTVDGETEHVDDVVFLEYESGNDTLRRSQIEWLLENVSAGHDVWIIWVIGE